MKLFQEFKDFAVKGNMMDMAIGIIIGASFNKVLDVLVKKIILPPLNYISRGVNLIEKRVILQHKTDTIEEISIQYGIFIETFIDFFVIGATLFVFVKIINKMRDRAEDVTDLTFKTPKDIQLLSDINNKLSEQLDILKNLKKDLE